MIDAYSELPLHDRDPFDKIDNNPNSARFGHVQILDKVANLEGIPDQLKEFALDFADRNKDELDEGISMWNGVVHSDFDKESDYALLLSAQSMIILLTMADTWGIDDNENREERRKNILVQLKNFRDQEIPFGHLDIDVKADEGDHRIYKRLGIKMPDYYAMARILPAIVAHIDTTGESRKELKDPSYVASIEDFKGIDFSTVLVKDVDEEIWFGALSVSHPGNEPPRGRTQPYRIKAQSPEEARLILLGHLLVNPSERPLIDIKINGKNYRRALKTLSEAEIKRLDTNPE